MGKLNWKGLLDHLIIVEGECMEENYGAGRAANEADEECHAGIRKAYAELVKVQPALMAAPEMFDALIAAKEELISLYEEVSPNDESDNDTTAVIDKVTAAIHKATGIGG